MNRKIVHWQQSRYTQIYTNIHTFNANMYEPGIFWPSLVITDPISHYMVFERRKGKGTGVGKNKKKGGWEGRKGEKNTM